MCIIVRELRIIFIQETDWIEKGPQQQHHLLERMSNKGHKVIVFDYEILWKENRDKGLLAKKINMKSPSKACPKCNIQLIRPRILRVPILNYLSLLVFFPHSLSKAIRKFKPDIIMGGGLLTVTIGQIFARRNKIPYIHFTTDKWHDAIPEKIFRRIGLALESRLASKANYNIVINEQLKDYELRIGAKDDTTKVIRAGVELDLFSVDPKTRKEMRTKYNYKENDRVLFFMGWLYTFSGLKEIVEELAKHEDKNIKLCIVGKGELHDELVRLRDKYNLYDQVRIIGWVNYRDLPKYLSMADICLLPAHNNKTMNEIVPIKLYEYLAVEKPVITTKLLGVMREFGDGNGIVYADNSRDVFKHVVNLSKNEINELGKKGKEFVKTHCNWEKHTNAYENIIRELINKNN